MADQTFDKEMGLEAPPTDGHPERRVWVKDDEEYKHFPHARWMNADVLNSPNLTRLFEGLAIETKDLSDDIEDLVLPPPSAVHRSKGSTEVVTWSDMTYQSPAGACSTMILIDGDTRLEPDPRWDELASEHCATARVNWETGGELKRSKKKAFRFPGAEVFFPSGICSPVNELYPFPVSSHRAPKKYGTSVPLMQTLQATNSDCTERLTLLERTGAAENSAAVLHATWRLAENLYHQGKFRQAEVYFRKVCAALQTDDEPWSEFLFDVYFGLINCITGQRRMREAEAMLKSVRESITGRFSPYHEIHLRYLTGWVVVLDAISDHDECESLCRDLVQICLMNFGPREASTLDAIHRLSYMMRHQGRYVDSERLMRIILQIYLVEFEEHYEDICESFRELGHQIAEQGQLDKATELCRVIVQRAKDSLGDYHWTTICCNRDLAVCLQKKGLHQESQELWLATLRLQLPDAGEDNLDCMCTMYEIGRCLHQRKHYEESFSWFEKCFRNNAAALEPHHWLMIDACKYLGSCYEELRRFTAAVAVYQQAIGFFESAKGSHEADIARLQRWVSRIRLWRDKAQKKIDDEGSDLGTNIIELE